MLSDQMENKKIMVGKQCMEHSEITLLLCANTTLISTDLAVAECRCLYPASIQSISLSPKEMTEFISFFSENENLQKIGFSESSLLFVARRQKIAVVVTDSLTESICKEMGIEIFKIESRGSNLSPTDNVETGLKTSRKSRLGNIIRAACL